jgi:hypothetical protein
VLAIQLHDSMAVLTQQNNQYQEAVEDEKSVLACKLG